MGKGIFVTTAITNMVVWTVSGLVAVMGIKKTGNLKAALILIIPMLVTQKVYETEKETPQGK
jgi:hypothetical protein